MSIEYRGGNSYRFRVKSEGAYYSTKFISLKTISPEDVKEKKWPKDVEDAHKDYEVSIMRKEIGNNENMPFNELCLMVHDEYNKSKLRASTIRRCMSFINIHYIPFFKDKPIGKISALDIEKFINVLKNHVTDKGNKLTNKTILTIVKELQKIFNRAIKWKFIKENPVVGTFDDITKSIVKKKYTELLPLEDINKLIQAIDEMKDDGNDIMYKCIFTIAMFSGMREGEILGMCLRYINLKECYYDVTQQWGEVIEDNKFTRNLTDTKTLNSVRRVYFLQKAIDTIKKYVAYKKIVDLDTPLFTNKTTGKPYTREAVTARFRKLLQENNIPPIRFHDARHLNASLQIASGVDPVTVALALGDNVETILNNYTHGIGDVLKKSTEQLDSFLKEIKTN